MEWGGGQTMFEFCIPSGNLGHLFWTSSLIEEIVKKLRHGLNLSKKKLRQIRLSLLRCFSLKKYKKYKYKTLYCPVLHIWGWMMPIVPFDFSHCTQPHHFTISILLWRTSSLSELLSLTHFCNKITKHISGVARDSKMAGQMSMFLEGDLGPILWTTKARVVTRK